MARAQGNDLCEIFGYAPDDVTDVSRKQWKRQECPFVGGTCVKHSHPRAGQSPVIFGSCSVVNKLKNGEKEEVILCPQRLYANSYEVLKTCVTDATGKSIPVFLASDKEEIVKAKDSLRDYVILFGHKSGGELFLSGNVSLSLDWVIVRITDGIINSVIPCEVQSIDTTGNYHDNWKAYAQESSEIPNSMHGMNWANVWKRMIPQIILKGAVAKTSNLCKLGTYFILPDRVYRQFEKLIGHVPKPDTINSQKGFLTVMTYDLSPKVEPGKIRSLKNTRKIRMKLSDFAEAFASGKQLLPLGKQLDDKIYERISILLGI